MACSLVAEAIAEIVGLSSEAVTRTAAFIKLPTSKLAATACARTDESGILQRPEVLRAVHIEHGTLEQKDEIEFFLIVEML